MIYIPSFYFSILTLAIKLNHFAYLIFSKNLNSDFCEVQKKKSINIVWNGFFFFSEVIKAILGSCSLLGPKSPVKCLF